MIKLPVIDIRSKDSDEGSSSPLFKVTAILYLAPITLIWMSGFDVLMATSPLTSFSKSTSNWKYAISPSLSPG